MKLEQKFLVERCNYASDTKDFFIYKVLPMKPVHMQRHPKYRSYSVKTRSELIVGETYQATLEVTNKNGFMDYEVANVKFEFPERPLEQWQFLERVCTNGDAKRMFKALDKAFTRAELILNLLLDDDWERLVQEKLDEKHHQKLEAVRNRLSNMQSIARFLDALPVTIAEELSDHEAEHLSRLNEHNPELSAQEFVDNPWVAMRCDGFGFKKVDKIRGRLAELDPENVAYAIDNYFRVYYGAYDVLENRVFREGHTYITVYEFKSLMVQDLHIDREVVNEFIDYGYRNVSVWGYFKIRVNEGIVTSERLWNAERTIYDRMKSGMKPKPIPNFDQRLEAFKVASNLTLTDEQMSIFDSMNRNQFSMLTGPGGTGKTFTVSKLIEFLRSIGMRVTLCAPTGKAAQVLKGYANFPANTIHNIFQIQPGIYAAPGTVPKSKPEVIVIDEFSMVDSELMGDLISTYAKEKTLPRFLFIGDENQLPSVGAGNLLHSFIKLKMVEITRLTKVFRIKSEEGGITTLTEALRKGVFPFKNNEGQIFPVGKDFWGWHSATQEEVFSRTCQAYRTMLRNGVDTSDIVVLSPKNQGLTGQHNLNQALQEIARHHFELPEDAPHHTYKSFGVTTRFYEGDIIMSLANRKCFTTTDRDADFRDFKSDSPSTTVSNGDVGRVTFIGPDFLLADFSGESCFVPADEIKTYQLGYAYTIHKSQGSEAKYGILTATSADYYQLNSNLIYTGASRFKEKLYLIGDFKTLRAKAKVFINQDRRTLLELFDELDNLAF